jgi:hypothetical protein
LIDWVSPAEGLGATEGLGPSEELGEGLLSSPALILPQPLTPDVLGVGLDAGLCPTLELREGLRLGEESTLGPMRGLGLGELTGLRPAERLGEEVVAALGLGLEAELGESCLVGPGGRLALWSGLEPAMVSSKVKLSITCTSPGGSSRMSTMCTTLRPTMMFGARTVAFHPLALVKSTSLRRTLTVRFSGMLLGPGLLEGQC